MREIAILLQNFNSPQVQTEENFDINSGEEEEEEKEEEEIKMATNNNVDTAIANKVEEIRSQPYAKYVFSEDVIERNFGYKIIRQQVSSGRNSFIYRCETVKRQDLYCLVKAYPLGKDKIKMSLREETMQIMRFVCGKCPTVLSTYDAFYTNEKIYLMCDWTPKGEVLANLRGKIRLNEEMLRNWTIDILNAVNFLQMNAICHRNIAPNCLLLTNDMRVKVSSLSDAVVYCKPDGSLLKQKWGRFSRAGNWNQGPEVAKGRLYDPRRADVWSIGATVFWFITKSYPIDYRKSTKMTEQLEHRFKMMHKVSERCIDFVKKMLTYQPSQRPTIAQAMQFDWIVTPGHTSPVSSAKKASPSGRADNEISTAENQENPGEVVGVEYDVEVSRSGSRAGGAAGAAAEVSDIVRPE